MSLSRAQATLAAGIASLALVVWGASRAVVGFDRQAWYALEAEEPEDFLALEGSAPEPLLHVRRADMLSEDVFPPDHARAIEECRAALVADPMYSRAWLALARERILTGDLAQARAALEASDRFAPVYPSERTESLSLWRMLGDDEKCVQLARRIAALGTEQTAAVAGELLRLGFDPPTVLDAVRFDELGTLGRLALLRVFHKEAPGSAGLLIERLPEEDLEYSELRRYIAPFLMKPLAAPMLGEVWNLSDPALRLVGGMVLVENLNLDQPPFSTGFPMGWLALEKSDASAVWEPGNSQAGGDGTGRIQFTLPRYVRRTVEWPCYRLLADAGPEFEARLHLTPALARSAEVSLVGTMSPDVDLGKAERRAIGETPFELGLIVPARTEPALVTLALRWTPLVDPVGAKADALFVDRLDILLPQGATDAPAGGRESRPVELAPDPVDALPSIDFSKEGP